MAYKQGYSDRLDESLGMRRGRESMKSQSYKARRDESRGMKDKIMGHEKMPKEVYAPCGEGFSEVKPFKPGALGYPKQAWDYKY